MPRSFGQVATSATDEVPVNATAYTEQTSGAQRSLVSSSANDAAAGTGARTVKITYFTLSVAGVITGPHEETVTLNGTTAVDTVNDDIALIEKIEVLTAGSGGVSAGTISLKAAAEGGGATIASIAAGALQTFLAHHYVPNGRQCRVSQMSGAGGHASMALMRLLAKSYPGLEKAVTEKMGVTSTLSQKLDTDLVIPGPARIRLMTAPSSDAQTTYGGFDFVDQV